MEQLQSLLIGFVDILDFEVFLWSLIGIILGTLIGALPGLGSMAGISILLPLSFTLEPLSALMLLMGIYQGSMYGGRITAILLNVPGESSDVVATFDGYPLTKQGKAGYALGISAIASFIGGMIGFIGLVFLTTYIAQWALSFSSPEYFALMLFALLATSGLGGGSLLKGLIAISLGLLVSLIGTDVIQGVQRLTYGYVELWDGINFIVVAVGIFGLSEVLLLMESTAKKEDISSKIPFKDLFPKISDIIRNLGAILRGAITGFLIGVLPGAGSTIATFISYNLEKKVSKTPEKFGTGVDKGLSSPEACNNATIGGALIPLFSLGIPGSGTTAVLLGALIMLGLQPGPLMFEKSGDIIWACIAGLMVANVLLLILNTAFVPLFTVMIEKLKPYLTSLVGIFCFFGIYMLNYNLFEVGLMILFGVIGYFFRKYHFPLAPMVLAVVLGPMIESGYRQSMIMSKNSLSIFFTRPISLTLMILTILILLIPMFRYIYRKVKSNNYSVEV